jgi:hypothetical protein
MSRKTVSQLLAKRGSAEESADLLCNRVSIRRRMGEEADVVWDWVIWAVEEASA